MKGKFIVFDGCDFAGKTTQIRKVSEYLDDKNIRYIITREPGGTEIGEDIRSVILHSEKKLVPNAEILIFTALRCEHIETKIKPMLEDGVYVICDRFLPSTFVYQSVLHKIDRNIIFNLHSTFANNIQPDLTFILDVEPNIALQRMQAACKDERNLYDSTKLEEIAQIRSGFLEFAKLHQCNIIDANNNTQKVFDDIKTILDAAVSI